MSLHQYKGKTLEDKRITRNNIKQRYYESSNKNASNGSMRWSEDDVNTLLDNMHLSDMELSFILHRTIHSIQTKRTRLRSDMINVPYKDKYGGFYLWAPEEDYIVTHLSNEDCIKKLNNRTISAINQRRYALNKYYEEENMHD